MLQLLEIRRGDLRFRVLQDESLPTILETLTIIVVRVDTHQGRKTSTLLAQLNLTSEVVLSWLQSGLENGSSKWDPLAEIAEAGASLKIERGTVGTFLIIATSRFATQALLFAVAQEDLQKLRSLINDGLRETSNEAHG